MQDAEEAVQTVTKPIGGDKNGGTRTIVLKKGPKWYPADDIKKPVPTRKHIHKPTRLRSTIKPGSVLILLSGRYRGMRVIFLKQLASGLLLVTGPMTVNGIPMRRVDQAYVIATSTVVDVSKVDVKKFDDAYFKRTPVDKEEDVMEDAKETTKPAVSKEKIADQKTIDSVLVPIIDKETMLRSYLKSKFTLAKGQYPHEMKF